MKKIILTICFMLTIVGCSSSIESELTLSQEDTKMIVANSQERIEETFTSNNENVSEDLKIMEARSYVGDFDSRMSNAQEYIKECLNNYPINERSKVLKECTIIAYDMNKFYRNGTEGETYQLAFSEKETYRKYHEIAKKQLSSEVGE